MHAKCIDHACLCRKDSFQTDKNHLYFLVDVMSTADQYFTPEPPSSPSSVSASVKATGSPTPTND